jgi:hypothetical protein
MKHVKLFESFIAEGDKYDEFISRIDKLPETEKEKLSDHWMGPEGEPSPHPIISALGSAVWTTLSIGKGKGFKDRALKFLRTAGSANPQKDLDDFIESY